MGVKSKKMLLLIFLGIILAVSLHARGRSDGGVRDLTIYSVRGPTGVGMIRLFDSPPEIDGFNVSVEALAHVDLIAARFISGQAFVGILPPNMAARIASSGRDIRAAAVINTGMLSLLTSDPDIRGIAYLRGRTVQVAGQGATPDFVFRRILAYHGLTAERDVTLGFALAFPEIAQSLIAGRISTALLPEPFASMALLGRPDLRHVADIQEEWTRAANAAAFPMTLLVVDGAFADANPAAMEKIIYAVKESIEWVKANPAGAGAMVERHDLGLGAAIVAASVPRSNFAFIRAHDARPSLEALFNVFLEHSPASIGGALPDDRFYFSGR